MRAVHESHAGGWPPTPCQLDGSPGCDGDACVFQEPDQERLPGYFLRAVSGGKGRECLRKSIDFDVPDGHRVTDHSGKMPAINAIGGQIRDGSDHRGAGQALHHAPVAGAERRPVEADVDPTRLPAAGHGELVPVGIDVAELVRDGRGAVRDHLRMLASKSLSSGTARVNGQPRCPQIVA